MTTNSLLTDCGFTDFAQSHFIFLGATLDAFQRKDIILALKQRYWQINHWMTNKLRGQIVRRRRWFSHMWYIVQHFTFTLKNWDSLDGLIVSISCTVVLKALWKKSWLLPRCVLVSKQTTGGQINFNTICLVQNNFLSDTKRRGNVFTRGYSFCQFSLSVHHYDKMNLINCFLKKRLDLQLNC